MEKSLNKSAPELLESYPLILTDQYDFDANSLIDTAIEVESELTCISVKQFHNELRLQHLVISSKLAGFPIADKEKLAELLHIIYQQQNFQGDWRAFFKVKNALISRVLSRRKGIPISLGILILDLLQACDFKAQGICFPSGFMIAIHLEDELVYLDPFTGELPLWNALELKVRGQLGNLARLTLDMLKPDNNLTIIKRYINVIKASYIQAEKLELALLCSDILLRIDPQDNYEVRDRGFLFQQLECFKLARDDFEFFIEKFPEDPIVGALKIEIKHMDIEHSHQVIH